MRIGLIAPPWLPVPPPRYGGTEAVIDNLARGLRDLGHDVVLFTVREETTASIRRFAVALHPALADAPLLDILVGLRPGRPQVRLEKELYKGRPLIHNYGHGGSGFTLSWGCAADVAQWIE